MLLESIGANSAAAGIGQLKQVHAEKCGTIVPNGHRRPAKGLLSRCNARRKTFNSKLLEILGIGKKAGGGDGRAKIISSGSVKSSPLPTYCKLSCSSGVTLLSEAGSRPHRGDGEQSGDELSGQSTANNRDRSGGTSSTGRVLRRNSCEWFGGNRAAGEGVREELVAAGSGGGEADGSAAAEAKNLEKSINVLIASAASVLSEAEGYGILLKAEKKLKRLGELGDACSDGDGESSESEAGGYGEKVRRHIGIFASNAQRKIDGARRRIKAKISGGTGAVGS
jgi:hypothetical protein